MAKAVLIDLCHLEISSWNTQTQESISKILETVGEKTAFQAPSVYLMCCQTPGSERNGTDGLPEAAQGFHCPEKGFTVVCCKTTAAVLYTVKQKLDEKDINTVEIILPVQRKPLLREYINQLFTKVYQFEFKDLQLNGGDNDLWEPCTSQGELVPLTDQDVESIRSEIGFFLGSLPGLKGNLTILKSSLIPDHVFLHGFTTRTGGISYIPTLSSCNLFSSSKRRDPPAVVKENLRRLAAVAGLDADAYHSVRVNHASDVWVMGKAKPDSYDGIITNQKRVTIAAPGADCIPVLFADPVLKACGAAHSANYPWRTIRCNSRTFLSLFPNSLQTHTERSSSCKHSVLGTRTKPFSEDNPSPLHVILFLNRRGVYEGELTQSTSLGMRVTSGAFLWFSFGT
ncbi:purine nucleoside phosphorylase LACC1 isoform X2 [Varanus komodoensis]|uniref:purine nucleoside phosphorylase LACC1 isoform X2 n=1 Tax=Varanus komodoensis TaxID=61221 RepID=UPI001CF7CF6F|nr:purine nucleoside phosphorylase LACC1 isoform X2 [Varanus komodoensis]